VDAEGPLDRSPVDAAEPGDAAAQRIALAAERDRLVTEKTQLQAEKTELHDLLLRRQAEFDNFRRRAERDRSEFIQYAGAELVRDLLPVLDDFERASKLDSADHVYKTGVALIYQRLFDGLKKMGLEPLESAGRPFDPNLHQAVERVHTQDVPDQTVLEEYQRGYNFKGKLLRPAMVKVALNP
jgi:molecular chaperone GrpE